MEAGPSETRASSSPSHPLDPAGFAPGHILADRYRIVALVGRGGMGEVYRADDLKLGQPVALKFLPAELERDPAARDRLLAEVRSARTVSHPNVCRVYDVGELAGPALSERPLMNSGRPEALEGRRESKGRVFLTMEYIDGEDLASLLRRIGRLPAAKALEIARQLCAGLAAAHDKGVLHRDLKPANVMIDGRGQARITDFGLAISAGAAGSPADFAGTLAYMAPERFHGAPATVQSDLYGLGLILYETYTGKPAFKADSIREWERAHSDSTPTNPSSLATDVEPAVERAILRCLEKDPTKRPASAAQVAAALPGGDPLAAALAAGETPSPELVAASGEEGTLPRAKAWLWLAACLVAIALAPFANLPISLTEHIAFDLSSDVLQARAGEVLRNLGYADKPADRAWWFRTDNAYLDRLNRLRPAEAASELRAAGPGPLRFCYRQAPATLAPTAVWRLLGISSVGNVSAMDPTPLAGDVYVELHLDGGLVGLRVVPPAYGDAQPSSHVDWTALFDAAQLGSPDAFLQAAPQWWPEGGSDVREAREGVYHGQKVRVEAAARAGRPIFFLVLPAWVAPSQAAWTTWSRGPTIPTLTELLGWINLIVLAILARRNVRLGRGDRTGARRVALGAMLAQTVGNSLVAHPTMSVVFGIVPQALFLGLLTWLAYIGLEPPVRRTWPQLLIAWTRLIDGRWRDPLVGRALLAGVLVGLPVSVPWTPVVTRLLGLPGGALAVSPGDSFGGLGDFTGNLVHCGATALLATLVVLGLLLVARLIGRRTDVAWVVFTLVFLIWYYVAVRAAWPNAVSAWPAAVEAGVCGLLFVWVLWKHGALATAITWWVYFLAGWAPWTLDMSRWYAWRQWFVVAAIVALAVWGFRNVLGRQSAFPTGALEG